jgi:proteasome accessory factor B
VLSTNGSNVSSPRCKAGSTQLATAKIERLMNLVIALLSAEGYLPAERIRKSVGGYGDSPNAEAFSRMFERDKNELRDLGIPLETGRISTHDPTEGYRINRKAYALPDIDLNTEEAAAVAVASRLWQSPELITTTQSAVLKLRAGGVSVDADAPVSILAPSGLPDLRGSEDALGALQAAVDAGQAVQFQHRSGPTGPYTTRTVEPWGVITYQRRWYLVGHDRDRDDTRTFRLSRIGPDVSAIGAAGSVTRPAGVDLRAIVAQSVNAAKGEPEPGARASVWIADGQATALRRAGTATGERVLGGRPGVLIELDIRTRDGLAREIAGYGADAVVLAPASLRADVIERLSAHAGAGEVP